MQIAFMIVKIYNNKHKISQANLIILKMNNFILSQSNAKIK